MSRFYFDSLNFHSMDFRTNAKMDREVTTKKFFFGSSSSCGFKSFNAIATFNYGKLQFLNSTSKVIFNQTYISNLL